MTHGDDRGLVLPPNIAPTKVIIIPIGNDEKVLDTVVTINNKLKDKNITVKVDKRDKTPGFRFAEAEVKGYPIRVELGKRDLENNQVTLVRRDTLEKVTVEVNSVVEKIEELLMLIQKDMYDKALARRDSMIYVANNYEELKDIAMNKPGFVKVNWCGNVECENKIKEDCGIKSRCLIEDEEVDGPCVCCGEKASTKIYFGKQY